jgi:hypothetical protein
MVVGSRMLGTLRTSTINKFGNFGLKCISVRVTWRWLTDTESGFRAFRADKLYQTPLSRAATRSRASSCCARCTPASHRRGADHVPFAVPA